MTERFTDMSCMIESPACKSVVENDLSEHGPLKVFLDFFYLISTHDLRLQDDQSEHGRQFSEIFLKIYEVTNNNLNSQSSR